MTDVLNMDLISFGKAHESLLKLESSRQIHTANLTRVAHHADAKTWSNVMADVARKTGQKVKKGAAEFLAAWGGSILEE